MGYILIVGSSNIDMNIYSERLPIPGETITGGTFKQFLGGKGANQAVAAARAGARTFFMGNFGEDSYGDLMFEQLSREGIDLSCVVRDPSEASGVAFIFIDDKGENMISVAPGANARLSVQKIRENAEIILNASVVMAQMEVPLETLEELFGIADKGSAIKILNPAPLKRISRKLLKCVDIIVPNEGELIRLNSLLKFDTLDANSSGKIVKASSNLASLGVNRVVTTLGSKGSVVFDQKTSDITMVPTIKVNAVDTVGAGDCFNGVMACKLSEGKDLITAVKYATAAASIAVTRKGAQDSMPFKQEIERKFKEIYNLEIPQIEVEEVKNPDLDAQIMAERLAYSLDRGRHYRRAGHYILKKVMDAGAKGVEIEISGKLASQKINTYILKAGITSKNGPTSQKTKDKGIARSSQQSNILVVIVIIMQTNDRQDLTKTATENHYGIEEKEVPITKEAKKLLDEINENKNT